MKHLTLKNENNKIMIILNLYCEDDYNPTMDGFHLHLAAVVNDELDLYSDPRLIIECIENDPDFEPKAGHLYEIQLIRGTIASDPIPEPAFAIDRIIEKKHDANFGLITTLIQM